MKCNHYGSFWSDIAEISSKHKWTEYPWEEWCFSLKYSFGVLQNLCQGTLKMFWWLFICIYNYILCLLKSLQKIQISYRQINSRVWPIDWQLHWCVFVKGCRVLAGPRSGYCLACAKEPICFKYFLKVVSKTLTVIYHSTELLHLRREPKLNISITRVCWRGLLD